MTESNRADTETLIRAEVDRAVAPYVDRAPPFMLRKLRQLSERYWRENPVAVQALRLKSQQHQVRSGNEAIGPQEEQAADGTGRK